MKKIPSEVPKRGTNKRHLTLTTIPLVSSMFFYTVYTLVGSFIKISHSITNLTHVSSRLTNNGTILNANGK